MKEANNQKLYKAINALALIVSVLSLGHFVALELSIQHAQNLDDISKQEGVELFSVQQTIPFAIVLGCLGALQLASAVLIFILNSQQNKNRALYYCSFFGMIAAFAIGIQMVILAQEYNFMTRSYLKNSDLMPELMPLYYSIQLDGTVSLMLSFPMFAFIFYHQLDRQLQRDQYKLSPQELNNRKKAPFYLWIFLLHAVVQIGFIFLVYLMCSMQNKKDYTLSNQIDQYFYFLAMGIDSTIIAVVLQAKNIQSQFLNKKQVIIIALVVLLYQFGSFFLLAIKTAQIFIRLEVIQNDTVFFPDRENALIFRWQILGYTVINLAAICIQFPYLNLIKCSPERQEIRDTLITSEEGIIRDQKE